MKPRTRRLGWILGGLAVLGVAAALILNAFQSNLGASTSWVSGCFLMKARMNGHSGTIGMPRVRTNSMTPAAIWLPMPWPLYSSSTSVWKKTYFPSRT